MPTSIAEQLITRAKLSATHRIRRAYGGQLSGTYAHARNTTAQSVLLDKGDDIQAEVDRICSLYRTSRRIIRVRVQWGSYQLGQIVALNYPRYGLDAINCMIVKRQRDLVSRTIVLTLWG